MRSPLLYLALMLWGSQEKGDIGILSGEGASGCYVGFILESKCYPVGPWSRKQFLYSKKYSL